ncbi:hypothetical protein XENOCAPTIV_014294 [Xenoophorus captivus]|uniref:EB1 C-terminal domain-containing protein n=1 Tax=Xenoophorus captivus TaxID=1517983 RepID=A0ABV0QWQ4_9TELE
MLTMTVKSTTRWKPGRVRMPFPLLIPVSKSSTCRRSLTMQPAPPLQVNTLKLALEGVEKERDYYFSKLREVEMLCQEQGEENTLFVERLMEVLYAAEEQVGIGRSWLRVTGRKRTSKPTRGHHKIRRKNKMNTDCHHPSPQLKLLFLLCENCQGFFLFLLTV